MADLKVDSQAVIKAASRITFNNNKITEDYSKIESAIRILDGNWDGSASEKAISEFRKIKSAYSVPRSEEMKKYIAFMLEQVGEGYEQTEKDNTSLASRFK